MTSSLRMMQDPVFRLTLRLCCFAALYLLGLVVFYRLGLAGVPALGIAAGGCMAVIAAVLAFALSNRRRRRLDRRAGTLIAAGALAILLCVMYAAPATHLLVGPFVFSGLAASAHRLSRPRAAAIGATASAAYLVIVLFSYLQGRNDALLTLQLLHLLTFVLAVPGLVVLAGQLHTLSGALREASSKLHDIHEDARRDHLTGCYNRRYTSAVLEQQKRIADETVAPLCLAVLDLDRFKSINDQSGHLTGDRVLQAFASVALSNLRQGDVFGRYGGEEFLLVLPDTPLHSALHVVERIRGQVEANSWADASGNPLKRQITVSIGLTQYIHGESVLDLFARADTAMYLAKSSGRNQVVVEEPVDR